MLKKLLILSLVLVMGLFACACGGDGDEPDTENLVTKYQAKMYHNANSWMKQSFLDDNKTYGAYYGDEQLLDDSYPKSRTFTIKTPDEFDEIFTSFPHEVDFGKDILFIHIVTSLYGAWASSYSISDMTIEDKKLQIKYKYEVTPGMGENARPHQRCLVVKMTKPDMDTVEFVEVK